MFSLTRRVVPFLVPFRRHIVLVVLVGTLTAAAAATEPLLLKAILDSIRTDPRRALRAGVLLGAALLAREAFGAWLDWLVWRGRIGLDYALLSAMIERLHALPLSFHRKHSVGALMTKVERGIGGTVSAFSALGSQLLPSCVYLVTAIVFMMSLEWRLGIVVLVLAPLPAVIGALAAPEQVRRERTLLDRWTQIFSRFNEVLSGILVVKSFSMEEAEKRRFLGDVSEANRVVVNGVARDASVSAIKNTVALFARLLALAIGGALVADGEMELGTLVAFLSWVAGTFQPVQSLTGVYQTLRRGRVALETVFDIAFADDTMGDAPDAIDPGPLRGAIELRDVRFGYRQDEPVLSGIRLRIAPGETIAFVGPSGGGKSTLMALLQRLYDPWSGSIHLDGHDLRRLKQRAIREQIGVVLQDGMLFSETVHANIAFGTPHASRSEIEAAARAANAHDFITKLPEGYDTVVGPRGSTLSGGEQQRIAIARALLKDAPILVLDEATSALDNASEALVRDALARLKRGRTTLVIAHRLGTIVDADRICVLDGGVIVEEGNHDALLAQRGVYASLASHAGSKAA
jgi:ATP-binding cassette, subfamily B, bacterial